jgi:hypothetical protein
MNKKKMNSFRVSNRGGAEAINAERREQLRRKDMPLKGKYQKQLLVQQLGCQGKQAMLN